MHESHYSVSNQLGRRPRVKNFSALELWGDHDTISHVIGESRYTDAIHKFRCRFTSPPSVHGARTGEIGKVDRHEASATYAEDDQATTS